MRYQDNEKREEEKREKILRKSFTERALKASDNDSHVLLSHFN